MWRKEIHVVTNKFAELNTRPLHLQITIFVWDRREVVKKQIHLHLIWKSFVAYSPVFLVCPTDPCSLDYRVAPIIRWQKPKPNEIWNQTSCKQIFEIRAKSCSEFFIALSVSNGSLQSVAKYLSWFTAQYPTYEFKDIYWSCLIIIR